MILVYHSRAVQLGKCTEQVAVFSITIVGLNIISMHQNHDMLQIIGRMPLIWIYTNIITHGEETAILNIFMAFGYE